MSEIKCRATLIYSIYFMNFHLCAVADISAVPSSGCALCTHESLLTKWIQKVMSDCRFAPNLNCLRPKTNSSPPSLHLLDQGAGHVVAACPPTKQGADFTQHRDPSPLVASYGFTRRRQHRVTLQGMSRQCKAE